MSNQQSDSGRRDFLKAGAAAAGAALTGSLLSGGVHAAGSDEIKVGIIGCGDRGTGAGKNVLEAAKGVTIVAMGDAFEDRLKQSRNLLTDFVKDDKKAKVAVRDKEADANKKQALDEQIKAIEAQIVPMTAVPGDLQKSKGDLAAIEQGLNQTQIAAARS